MQRSWCIILLVIVLGGFMFSAKAEEDGAFDQIISEQWDAAGMEDLWETLPNETKDLLNEWGMERFSDVIFTNQSPTELLAGLTNLLKTTSSGPLATCGIVMGIVLLCGLVEGMRPEENVTSHVFAVVATVASYAAVLLPLVTCLHKVEEAISGCNVFMTAYIPTYAAIMVTGGQAVLASSYQTTLLFACELMIAAVSRWILPCLLISIALGFAGSVSPQWKLHTVAGTVNKTAVWCLSLMATLFAGLLTMQSMVASAVDSLGGRAIRFSLSSFIPVVGGALGEAFNTVRGCFSLLHTGAGTVGIVVIGMILLPPFIEILLWSVCLSFCGMAADLLNIGTLGGLLRSCQSAVKVMIGILAICGLLLIVGTTVVVVAGKGASV